MSDSAADRLKRFEVEEDERVAQLGLTQLSLRGPLGVLHGLLDRLAYGDRILGGPPDEEKLDAFSGRYFGTWAALGRCDRSLGDGYQQEMERYQQLDPTGAQLQELAGYGHLCEIMPEVHEGLWAVVDGEPPHFVLHHEDDRAERFETLDFLLLQLVLSYSAGPFFIAPQLAVKVARRVSDPAEACQELRGAGRELRQQYIMALSSPAVLSDDGFMAAVDVSRNAFRRVQATLFALADIHASLANAHYGFALQTNDDVERWRAMEYASAVWPWPAMVEWISGVAAVEEREVERLLAYFVLDLRDDEWRVTDGYAPPLTRLEERVVIAPALVRLCVLERNIVFSINASDRQRFDNVVSNHLEPELLVQAERLFSRHPRLIVRRSVHFNGGEMDLLVYDPAANVALHVQAKAAVAPQGARMTRQVQQRALEALGQLRRFAELNGAARDEVIGNAIGDRVADVDVVEAVLSRSCFGRAKVWSEAAQRGAALLNLGLLALLLSDEATATSASLADLAADALALLDDMADESGAEWTSKTVEVGDRRIDVPMLDYDRDVVMGYRRRVAAAS